MQGWGFRDGRFRVGVNLLEYGVGVECRFGDSEMGGLGWELICWGMVLEWGSGLVVQRWEVR